MTTRAMCMAFNTTYKGNVYSRPLMPIVGVNHHHQTIVFGVAILTDETVDTFEWVLRGFLAVMFNKEPVSVVTDGDRAIQSAIKTVLPGARHHLCYWYMSRNTQANISDKNFTSAFGRCMSAWWTIDEFDREWRSFVQRFNVEDHPWVVEKDQTIHMWAQEYLTVHFFANVRSTQRCEAMNVVLEIVLKVKKTYLDFVQAIDNGINDMHIKELNEDFHCSQAKPFPTMKLNDLEGHAADVYTRASFELVLTELKYEILYLPIRPVVEEGGARTYRLTKYKDPTKMYELVLDGATHNLTCSCRKFETVGLPCRHQLHVLKFEDFSHIPKCLILPRWKKQAKVSAPSFVHFNGLRN